MVIFKNSEYEVELIEVGDFKDLDRDQLLWVRWTHFNIGDVQLRIAISKRTGGKPSVLISHPAGTIVTVRKDAYPATNKRDATHIDISTQEELRQRPSPT